MPPRGVKSSKRKRQYEHIKQSARKRGKSTRRAKEIAARTVNKQRRQSGQAKTKKSASASKRRSSSTGSKRSRSSSAGKSRRSSSRGKKKS